MPICCRSIDDALGLTELAGAVLSDGRRGNNTRPFLTGDCVGTCSGGGIGGCTFARLESRQGRGAAHRDVAELEEVREAPLLGGSHDRPGVALASTKSARL
jgi:hypothetical protein